MKLKGKNNMKKIIPSYLANNPGHYSPMIISNGMLYVSGILSIDPDTQEVVQGSIEEHTMQALKNLDRLLKEAGTSKDSVVQCRVYISDVFCWNTVNKIYAEYFKDHKPVRTIVPTRELHHGCLIEIEAVAELEERL